MKKLTEFNEIGLKDLLNHANWALNRGKGKALPPAKRKNALIYGVAGGLLAAPVLKHLYCMILKLFDQNTMPSGDALILMSGTLFAALLFLLFRIEKYQKERDRAWAELLGIEDPDGEEETGMDFFQRRYSKTLQKLLAAENDSSNGYTVRKLTTALGVLIGLFWVRVVNLIFRVFRSVIENSWGYEDVPFVKVAVVFVFLVLAAAIAVKRRMRRFSEDFRRYMWNDNFKRYGAEAIREEEDPMDLEEEPPF